MEFKHCNHIVPKNRRISLYEPGNDSLINGEYATLEEAKKDFYIPDDVVFEQGVGQLFIGVPYSARKH